MQRLRRRNLLAEHWRCVIRHLLQMSDTLRLAGGERGLHRLRLQRRRNGQPRRSLLILCRRQVQGFDWQCRMQRLWSGDLLVEYWRYVIIDLLRLQSRQWLVLPSWIGVSTRGRVSRRVVLHGRLKRQTSVQSERREILP